VAAAVADPQGAIELAIGDSSPVTPHLVSASPEPATPSDNSADLLISQEILDPNSSSAFDSAENAASPASSIRPPYLISPTPAADEESMRMLTIYLRPSDDKVRDNLRIRQIYGTLIAYPGKDRFAFHVFERGRGYLIEFPNFTTGICPDLVTRLKTFIPSEQLRIEAITFQ
jgi:DNA polymerase-3 subunit alpha